MLLDGDNTIHAVWKNLKTNTTHSLTTDELAYLETLVSELEINFDTYKKSCNEKMKQLLRDLTNTYEPLD